MSKLRVEECIDRLNDIVDHAYPFLGRIIVKQESIIEQIDRIKGALPEDVNEAIRILRRRQDIIDSAAREAERIINDALNEKNRILSESELLRAVQEEAAVVREKLIAECEDIKIKAYNDADTIKMQATEEARRLREGIDRYAQEVLNTLEENLAQQQTTVQNGQRYLEQRKMEVQRSLGYEPSVDSSYQQETSQEEYARY